MSDERKSVSISGAGKLGGGEYGRVTISGSGKVDGDLVAEELRISGSGKVSGRTEAGQITVSGSARFDGDVVAEEIRVSGSTRVDGGVETKELTCSGSFRAGGHVSAEYLKATGSLGVGGDAEADIFRASGGFDIDGLLSADKIEIHIGGRCRAREIGGERIEVRRAGGSLLAGLVRILGVGAGVSRLETTLIEADQIVLEDTTADVVRGKEVEIGPGCRIGTVEYSEALKVHEDAEVKERKKR